MIPLLLALLAALLLVGGDDGFVRTSPGSDARWYEVRRDVEANSVRACDLLSRKLARASLGRVRPKPVEQRFAPDNDTCTYYAPGNRVTVSVGLYNAKAFNRTVRILPRIKRDIVLGRRAAYDRRLGYLVELPGRPYYLQATFFHVVHTHADRPASTRPARQVLTGQTTSAARFLCSLTGDPS